MSQCCFNCTEKTLKVVSREVTWFMFLKGYYGCYMEMIEETENGESKNIIAEARDFVD